LQISLFRGSTKPPADLNGTDSVKAVLAALEVEFLKFSQTSALSSCAVDKKPKILKWLRDCEPLDAVIRTVAQNMFSEEPRKREVLEDGPVLVAILRSLLGQYKLMMWNDPKKKLKKVVKFWENWQPRWDEMEKSADGDAVLAAFGSQLKINDLRLLSQALVIYALASN
jgi:hypothetical protein